MKRFYLILAGVITATTTFASPVNHPVGASLTYGSLSMPHTPIAYGNNPAVGATLLDDDKFGFGLGTGGFGIGLEFGKLENLLNDLNPIKSTITSMQKTLNDAKSGAGSVPDISVFEIAETQIQNYLSEAGNNLALDVDLNIDVLSPIVLTYTKWGSFGLTANNMTQSKLRFIDDPLEIDFLRFEFSTKSAAYLKAASVLEVSPFYSREIFKHEKGNLYGGARLNIYNVALLKSAVPFLTLTQPDAVVKDQLKSMGNSQVQTGVGLDIGAIWTTPIYRAGATLKNINAPSFKYPSVGRNCAPSDSGCWTVLALSDQIDLDEKYTMMPQLTVDGAVHSPSKAWVLGSSLDLNSVYDAVANEYQWFAISGSYTPKMWSRWFWVPGVRTGFRQNIAGTQMNHLTLGLTWLYVHLDVAYGLKSFDSSKVEQLKNFPIAIPRSFYLNTGVSFMF